MRFVRFILLTKSLNHGTSFLAAQFTLFISVTGHWLTSFIAEVSSSRRSSSGSDRILLRASTFRATSVERSQKPPITMLLGHPTLEKVYFSSARRLARRPTQLASLTWYV